MDLAALRRWWPLAAVVGLLFLASLAATRSTPQLDRIPPATEPAPTPTVQFDGDAEAEQLRPTPPAAVEEVSEGLPDWAGTAVLALLVVLLVTLIALIVWAVVRDRLRRRDARVRRRPDRQDPASTADELVAALDAGLLELSDTDLDPRRAVIACWVRLEQAAAAAGTPRHAGDSPTDLVARLLAEQHLDARVLTPFAAVYRQARYATHTVDDQMRRQATSALERLRTDLGAGVPS